MILTIVVLLDYIHYTHLQHKYMHFINSKQFVFVLRLKFAY